MQQGAGEATSFENPPDVIAEQQQVDQPATSAETGARDRPKRERKKPKLYEPTFKGKKCGMQFFNYATAKILPNNQQHTKYEDARSSIFNIDLTQMTADRAIKQVGDQAITALVKEYTQMTTMNVLEAICPDELTPEQKKQALRVVNLVKIKRDGTVRARMCANGAPHRKYIPREEAKSPTVSLDRLLGVALIAAMEKRHVMSFDVPSAYLHTDIPANKFRLLLIEGKYVDIFCAANSEFKQQVRMERGKKVLHVKITKALYVMIESALLWYQLFSEVLMGLGFELNPYDPCVANKIINGKQCTIAWYVDDNLITHEEEAVVEEIARKINELFPGLTTTKGKPHTFLGMEMIFNENETLKIGLRDYI